MLTFSKLTEANKELNWVIKILESSKNKDQLEISFRCFKLWIDKYEKYQCKNTKCVAFTYLKEKFLSKYKTKEQIFLFF